MDVFIFLQQGSMALIRLSESVMTAIFQASVVFKKSVFVSFLALLGLF